MKEFVNWAILAPGIIANSMAQAMKGMSAEDNRIKLYAVGSRNLERAKEFADKWGFEKAYGSYEELLADPDVDAVYIANPHAFHFDSTIQALNAGKHVLCEKPAGCNLFQLTEMIKTAQDKNLFFMEAMWTAFNPSVAKIREAIVSGKIGDLKHIESFFCNRLPYDPKSRLWDPDQAGGALLDLGIYNIFYSSLINGHTPDAEHTSIARIEHGVDAWNGVTIKYENGVTASFESSCDMPAGSNTHNAIIYGTKGFITVENFFMSQKAEIHTYTNEWGNENQVTEVIDEPFKINGYEYELIHSTDCILKGKTESDVHTFERSIKLCTMMDTLRKDWNMVYPFEIKNDYGD